MKALSVQSLTKIYSNGITALKGINLDVAEGDFFALLGQNGAGKSTTIGIICSLVNKTSGKVSIFGHDIDKELIEAKSLIGIVPQEMNFSLFDKVENILLNQAGYYGIPKKIAAVQMEKYLNEMGIWEMHNQPAFKLSGGMKRRLMIVRALMNQPRLLILDEPTAGVDVELRHGLWRLLTELNKQGTTIILTTHYLEEAEQLCKNVAIIDHGDIIENADMKSLVNRLDSQIIVLEMQKPLTALPDLQNYKACLMDETTLEVEITRGLTINQLFELLSQHQIRITSIHNKANRLEKLFMHLILENNLENKREHE